MSADQLTPSVKGISAKAFGLGQGWAELVGKNAGAAPEPDPAPSRAGALLRACIGCVIAPWAFPAGKFAHKDAVSSPFSLGSKGLEGLWPRSW